MNIKSKFIALKEYIPSGYPKLSHFTVDNKEINLEKDIDVLVKNDLVRKLELGDGKARYENKIDSHHHDHMICVQCGKIEEFMDQTIENRQDKIVKKMGFKMIRHIHQLFVVCNKCQ